MMDMSPDGKSDCHLRSGAYLGEISALCVADFPPHFSYPPYLLAGTGSELLLYDLGTGELVESFRVFEGIRVHGIACRSFSGKGESSSSQLEFKIAVFGERKLKMFTLCTDTELLAGDQPPAVTRFSLFQSLPKFSHWVLDACFLKDYAGSLLEGSNCLAVGCSDNSVYIWDYLRQRVIFEVRCPDKCLLYSMRIWGDELEALRIASGTIYNEIIVWKVLPHNCVSLENPVKLISSLGKDLQLRGQQYEAVSMCRLAGHEGSIFRIAWSHDGSKLISVSDDRSARLWEVHAERKESDTVETLVSHSFGPVLFGHTARVWDCCIFDSVIVTAGEDCTCRIWGLDGNQLKIIREHIGRGIWRCTYVPNSSLLITAGFDSAVKAQQLHTSPLKNSESCVEDIKELPGRTKFATVHIPRQSEYIGPMDSKSEYVRCLHFAREDTLYVATNNGYLYHTKLFDTGNVKWSKLVQVNEAVPIVCMDLLSTSLSDYPSTTEDWVAVGDGKGHMTVVSIINDAHTPKVSFSFTWSAGPERQLLGTYWCKSLSSRFIFTSDPRGMLRLWRLRDSSQSVSHGSRQRCDVLLIAEFKSCFGIRIMCLDASFEEEVLVCGDLRGNLVLFPLAKDLLNASVASEVKISTLNYFKGAHGISSVCSIAVTNFSSNQVDIHSTGGDGCICYLEYDRDQQSLEFLGMKQVKELSLVRCLFDSTFSDDSSSSYAIGFSSTNFLIWNLMTEAKIVQVPCGGWRRPYSYYLGDVPETQNCFAFVKDEVIHIHRYWILDTERKIYPRNLHLQFHGREMHSICFVSEDSLSSSKQVLFSKSCWVATGGEDGTVRLTRYDSSIEKWSASKLLGEHVGGSAVRSICFVSKVHRIATDVTAMPDGINAQTFPFDDRQNPSLLISVGAKRVLTCWKQKNGTTKFEEEAAVISLDSGVGTGLKHSSGVLSTMSFQWLSSDMPTKSCSTRDTRKNSEKDVGAAENVFGSRASYLAPIPDDRKRESQDYENDWRYLAVTAFLVKSAYSRSTVCFVVVASSDATLTLRALLLPYRLWFDIASLVSLSSPVLTLRHVIVPMGLPSEDNVHTGSLYLVISGYTDGSIAFWDLTERVDNFIQSVSDFQIEKSIDCQRRPRTGRGSQGGRWWKALGGSFASKSPCDNLNTGRTVDKSDRSMLKTFACGTPSKFTCPDGDGGAATNDHCSYIAPLAQGKINDSSLELCTIKPLQVLSNVHHSGVNCLHVSNVHNTIDSNFGHLYHVVSGGDDQALNCLLFDLQILPLSPYPNNKNREMGNGVRKCENTISLVNCGHNQNYIMRVLCLETVISAHSSAVKGIWTDGCWVFSTGLDQRIRCWRLGEHGKLVEHTQLIISVPEPETLDARACGKDSYQIVVAGRGMQMVEFSTSSPKEDED